LEGDIRMSRPDTTAPDIPRKAARPLRWRLTHHDASQAKLGKVLAHNSTSTEDAALFAAMLSLPNDGRPVGSLRASQRSPATNMLAKNVPAEPAARR
jgi:hypothetical protein